MPDEPIIHYATPPAPKRRFVLRPKMLTAAICCLAIGAMGYIEFGRNFTMLPQDSDLMSAAQVNQQNAEVDAKATWLEFGCAAMPLGLVGLVLMLFSFRIERPSNVSAE